MVFENRLHGCGLIYSERDDRVWRRLKMRRLQNESLGKIIISVLIILNLNVLLHAESTGETGMNFLKNLQIFVVWVWVSQEQG
jgi:hypothetical protein